MAWTDEEIETLKTLWEAGHSASQIARALKGAKTRNAVIGKATRLELPGRAKPSQPKVYRPRPATPKVPVQPVQRVPPAPPLKTTQDLVSALMEPAASLGRGKPWPASGDARGILELGWAQCRFPVGSEVGAGQLFCAAPALDEGCPYCADHRRIAWQGRAPAVKATQDANVSYRKAS